MKKKDIVYLVIAVAIFLVAGYVAYTQLLPKKDGSANKTVQVETVGIIPDQLSGTGLSALTDQKTKDFSSPVDLTGLNNSAPFGQ